MSPCGGVAGRGSGAQAEAGRCSKGALPPFLPLQEGARHGGAQARPARLREGCRCRALQRAASSLPSPTSGTGHSGNQAWPARLREGRSWAGPAGHGTAAGRNARAVADRGGGRGCRRARSGAMGGGSGACTAGGAMQAAGATADERGRNGHRHRSNGTADPGAAGSGIEARRGWAIFAKQGPRCCGRGAAAAGAS
ncbi:spidroin-2-like [Panicum virgatum]|uniref:spidroin-2-like n=1 Tax=Panicum virgatum TaxID=38727 RepID=UPI0019D5E560|nr:spidroin-2-like [Panicum virgatum]